MHRRSFLKFTAGSIAAAAPRFALAQNGPTTIRIASKDLLTTNPDDVAHIKRVEQALAKQGHDIRIQIVDLPSAGYADALSVKLLSGDIPDLIYFQGGDTSMVEQGILEDLRPWIVKTRYLKDALYPHNIARLQNYPYLLYVFPPRIPQPAIRKDWLDKAGGTRPETVDDYVALFRKIVSGDFDGNGKADTFGITTQGRSDPLGSTNELDSFFNQAFGVKSSWLKDAGGQWISARVSEAERSKIAFYASLRRQGLLDPEFVTDSWETKEDKFYTGRVGVVTSQSPENVGVYEGKMRQVHPGTQLAVLPPPQGVGGRGFKAIDVSKESRGFALSSQSPNKEAVMAFLDFLSSPEGQLMERMGFEGQQYRTTGDTYEILPAMSTWQVRFITAANWKPPVPLYSPTAEQWLANVGTYSALDNAFVVPADYAADLDAADNLYRSWIYKFISGAAPLDQWGQFTADWNAGGGARLTELARTTLNAGH